MNRSKKFILILGVALLSFSAMFAQVTYSPYYKVKEVNGTVDVAMEEVKKQLTEKGFEVLGTYHPEGKSTMGVLVFTRDDLKKAVISNRKRGIHAAVVRVGFISKGGKTTVSFTNPDYFNYAYFFLYGVTRDELPDIIYPIHNRITVKPINTATISGIMLLFLYLNLQIYIFNFLFKYTNIIK